MLSFSSVKFITYVFTLHVGGVTLSKAIFLWKMNLFSCKFIFMQIFYCFTYPTWRLRSHSSAVGKGDDDDDDYKAYLILGFF